MYKVTVKIILVEFRYVYIYIYKDYTLMYREKSCIERVV